MAELSIGILVDSSQKLQHFSSMVLRAGHRVGFSSVIASDSDIPDFEPPSDSRSVDAWVVDVHHSDDQSSALGDFLNLLIEQANVPVIVSDTSEFVQGCSELIQWERRTLQRLERLVGDVNRQAQSVANEVWVLAASTGGPAAVKDFLVHLPAALNLAFVYVQHIDKGQAPTLVKMMSNAGQYPVSIAKQGSVLTNNTITLVTADRSILIHDNGTLVVTKSPWSGFYAPSIDQVAANIARVYRQRSGIIVFTGMGDDGAASCRLIKQQGGNVWVQTPAQCVISSMPDSALATGSVGFSGSPAELADALVKLKSARQPVNMMKNQGSTMKKPMSKK